MLVSNSRPELRTVTPLPPNYRGVEDVRDAGTKGRYVNQGYSQTTAGDETLESEGFVQCSALVLQETGARRTYMAHIIKHGLTEDQSADFVQLPPGDYTANVFTGRCSHENGSSLQPVLNEIIREKQLGVRIQMQPDTKVDSDRFSVSFNPVERSVKLVKRENREVIKVSL